MTQARTMRRFAPWLVGLFLMAQFAGVVPLIAAHTLHVFESKQVISGDDGVTAIGPHGTHRHGLADLNERCCSFHHLAGVLPYAVKVNLIRIAKIVIVLSPSIALVITNPALLEWP